MLQLHLESFGANEEQESLQKWALCEFDEVVKYSVLNISIFTPCQYLHQFLNGLPIREVMLLATLNNVFLFNLGREQANTRGTNDTANAVVIAPKSLATITSSIASASSSTLLILTPATASITCSDDPVTSVTPVVTRRHILQGALLRSLLTHLRMHTYLVTSHCACLPRPSSHPYINPDSTRTSC